MIGGGVLGVLLVGFFADEPAHGRRRGRGDPVAAADHGGARRWSRRHGVAVAERRGEPDPGVHGPRPVLDPAGAGSADLDDAPSDDGTTPPPSDGTTTADDQHRHRRARRRPTRAAGRARSSVARPWCCSSVFSSGGQPMVQVEVDGQVFNNIAIGETFDNGRYELRSVSGDCATFLFGDESFTLCAELDEVDHARARRLRRSAHGGSGRRPAGAALGAAPAPRDAPGARRGRAEGVPYDVRMLRMLTAGESHGKALVAVLEGLPAGVPVDPEALAAPARAAPPRPRARRAAAVRVRPVRDPRRRPARAHPRLADRRDDPEPRVRRQVRAT